MKKRTILVFIDGLGWGDPDPSVNPQHCYGGDLFRLPALDQGLHEVPAGGWARPIDAVLGVEGVPQSATGQTSLLAGVNAQRILGKHLTGFPNEILRKVLLESSVLKTLTDSGLEARFLNAFRPRFWELTRERQLTLSATTVLARYCKLLYQRHRNYVEVAHRTGLDRRTVKKYVEASHES